MECFMCGSQAWCVDSEGEVQERLFCYDCTGRIELADEEETDAAIAAYEADLDLWGPEDGGCCPCGSPSCDGTCGPNIRDVEVDYTLGCEGCTSNECDECSEHNNFEGDCPF